MTASCEDVSVVVLAGGRGTRIQAIHPDIPKPMAPVAGKPFLHWLTRWLEQHGLRHFIYSTGYRSADIESWASNDEFPNLTRTCCKEQTPLGTGGGLFNCLDHCRNWIVVANGDGLVMNGVATLLDLRNEAGIDGGLLGLEVDDAERYGSLAMDADGLLTGFREKVPGRGIINGGLYIFRRDLLTANHIDGPCSIEYDLFPALIAAGAKLRVVDAGAAAFIDIGTPQTLIEAESFVKSHLLQR
jgi:D-glycero-alpha-D-manno-heptose 1-phosphate guanylyltransferase